MSEASIIADCLFKFVKSKWDRGMLVEKVEIQKILEELLLPRRSPGEEEIIEIFKQFEIDKIYTQGISEFSYERLAHALASRLGEKP